MRNAGFGFARWEKEEDEQDGTLHVVGCYWMFLDFTKCKRYFKGKDDIEENSPTWLLHAPVDVVQVYCHDTSPLILFNRFVKLFSFFK